MPLHCRQYRCIRSLRDRIALFVVHPPVAEGLGRSYIETLFCWGSFCKRIGDIGTEDDHVFGGSDSIENACTHLVNTICICILKDSSLTRQWGTVACAPRIFLIIHILNIIRPDKVEHCVIRSDHPRKVSCGQVVK